MPYDEFWHNSLERFLYYYNGYIARQEQIFKDMQTQAWRIGEYMIDVFAHKPIMAYMGDSKEYNKISIAYPERPRWLLEELKNNNLVEVTVNRPTEERKRLYEQKLKEKEKNKQKSH